MKEIKYFTLTVKDFGTGLAKTVNGEGKDLGEAIVKALLYAKAKFLFKNPYVNRAEEHVIKLEF